MTPTNQGSIRLLRLAGIELYLHWSWFLVAYYGISQRVGRYTSPIWPVLEYLALFGIVLLHEFGHALACRQVGGQADRIVLWPLGGVAYVNPPQRPGAMLWSIAAGPLVNVVLIPVLLVVALLMDRSGLTTAAPNVRRLMQAITYINLALLIFNLLPIYPLDGGQILRSVLWFVLGRAWSLMVVTVIGFLGVAGLILLAVLSQSVWLGLIAVFILLNCWRGLRQAVQLIRAARIPRHVGFACPACRAAPPPARRVGPHRRAAPSGSAGIVAIRSTCSKPEPSARTAASPMSPPNAWTAARAAPSIPGPLPRQTSNPCPRREPAAKAHGLRPRSTDPQWTNSCRAQSNGPLSAVKRPAPCPFFSFPFLFLPCPVPLARSYYELPRQRRAETWNLPAYVTHSACASASSSVYRDNRKRHVV